MQLRINLNVIQMQPRCNLDAIQMQFRCNLDAIQIHVGRNLDEIQIQFRCNFDAKIHANYVQLRCKLDTAINFQMYLFFVVKLESKVKTSVLGLGVDFVLPLSQQQQESSQKSYRRDCTKSLKFGIQVKEQGSRVKSPGIRPKT